MRLALIVGLFFCVVLLKESQAAKEFVAVNIRYNARDTYLGCLRYGYQMARIYTTDEFYAAQNVHKKSAGRHHYIGLRRTDKCSTNFYWFETGECLDYDLGLLAWKTGGGNYEYGFFNTDNYWWTTTTNGAIDGVLCQRETEVCEDPVDDNVLLFSQDNLDSSIAISFSHKKITGTTLTNSETEGGSTTTTISSQTKAGLKGVFSKKLGYSEKTKYDWRKTTTETYAQSVTNTVRLTCPARTECNVYQVVGFCGRYVVGVDKFKMVTTSAADAVNASNVRNP